MAKNSKNKKIKTNPDKQLLACDQIVTFDKKGKVIKTEWQGQILEN